MEGVKGEKKNWDNYNSIINKLYLKIFEKLKNKTKLKGKMINSFIHKQVRRLFWASGFRRGFGNTEMVKSW